MGLRHIGIGKESTWNTGVAPTDFFNAVSADLAFQREVEELVTLDVASPRILTLGQFVGGTTEVSGNYHALGPLFKALFGAVTTSGVGPYTHTFPGSSGLTVPRPSYTIEVRKDGALNCRYAGCILGSLGLTSAVDRSVRVSASWLGGSLSTADSPASASYPTFLPILHKELALTIDAQTIYAKSFEVTAEFALDKSFDCSGGVVMSRQPIEVGPFRVTGRIEVPYLGTVEMAKVISGADVDIAAAWTSGTSSLTLNLNKAKLVGGDPAVQGRERIMHTIEFQSGYDSSTTENLQVVLVNADVTIP